jgi:hypothetical protein
MLEIIFQETYHLNLFAMCQHYFHCVSVNLMVKIFETPKYLELLIEGALMGPHMFT